MELAGHEQVTTCQENSVPTALLPDPLAVEREQRNARMRRLRYRDRLRKAAWRGRAILADPSTCPYRQGQEDDPCGGCIPGRPCRLEVGIWDSTHRAALRVMSDASATLRATIEVRVIRALARGEDVTELLLRLWRIQVEDERRREYQEHLGRRLEADLAARPKPFAQVMEGLLAASRKALPVAGNGNGGASSTVGTMPGVEAAESPPSASTVNGGSP